MNYTYLLRCADGSLYCGWTNRLKERVEAHNAGKGAKYTKSRRPVVLAYYEVYATRGEAMRREAAIKRLTKREKEALAARGPLFGDRKEGMKIIISPAKKMRVFQDVFPWREMPVYIKETERLLELLKTYTEPELKALFKANDSITRENFLRYRDMDLRAGLTPAALAYVGIQYQYMAPQIFSEKQWAYVCRHLRILSGFYGILRADDGIVPYRLEMQARMATERGVDLYAYWGDRIWRALAGKMLPPGTAGNRAAADSADDRLAAGAADDPAAPGETGQPAPSGAVILNLASKEYSRAVERWLCPEDRLVTCVFGTLKGGDVKVKATEAKMARGEMVRFLAEREIGSPEGAMEFDRLGFSFDPSRSGADTLVFLK